MKRKLLITSASLIVAFLLGSAQGAEGPDSLTAARGMWSKEAPESYTYVVQEHSTIVTYCIGPNSKRLSLNPLKISVRAGTITRVESLRDGRLPASCLKGGGLYTIDWLFDLIEREQGECDGRPKMEVTYDAKFGFPNYVNERCVLDGSSYTVRSFRVLK